VDADEDGGCAKCLFAHAEGDVVLAGQVVFKGVDREFTKTGWQLGCGGVTDHPFVVMLEAPVDQIRNCDQEQVVLVTELDQLGQTRHGAIVVHDLTDGAGGFETGQTGQVDGGFSVAGALDDAALAGDQGEDMAWFDEVVAGRGGVAEQLDGGGAFMGGDAGVDGFGVDGDGEGGAHALRVALDHQGQVEFLGPGSGDRGADHALAVGGHEIDRLWRCFFGGHQQSPFVFTVFVIDDNDHLTIFDRCDGLFDGAEHGWVLLLNPCSRRNSNMSRLDGWLPAVCSGELESPARPSSFSSIADDVAFDVDEITGW
jgi:hypothetical protein